MIVLLGFLFGVLSTIATEFAVLMGAVHTAQTSFAQVLGDVGTRLDQIVVGF
jgi:hypothetical protein